MQPPHLMELEELVEDGEVIMLQTDKSEDWVVCDEEVYLNTTNQLTQCNTNGAHTYMWIKMFCIGAN